MNKKKLNLENFDLVELTNEETMKIDGGIGLLYLLYWINKNADDPIVKEWLKTQTLHSY
jgi:hypothetical protein